MALAHWFRAPIPGNVLTGVVRPLDILDDSLVRAEIVGSKQTCLVASSLKLGTVYTLYGYPVLVDGLLILTPAPSSTTIVAEACTAASVSRIVEVCSGIVGIGVGAEKNQFEVHGL